MNEKIEGTLSSEANWENLKKQAKRLLREVRENNPHAISRLSRANVNAEATGTSSVVLADAQRVIARENGASTWEELKRRIESNDSSGQNEETPISIKAIDQIWLDCKDLKDTARFYGEVMGLEKTGEVPGQMLFYDCGGVTLLLGVKEEIRPNSILYLNCGNSEAAIQNAYNRLKSAGVSVGQSPHCIARNWQGVDVWMAFFSDPSGNQLAFKCNVPAREVTECSGDGEAIVKR